MRKSRFQGRGQPAEVKAGVSAMMINQARSSGSLNISGRSLAVVPMEVWRINVDAGEGQQIDMSAAGGQWWDQTELTKLFLSSNHLTEIPSDIQCLPALASLDAHDNKISKLSPDIVECQQLKILNFGHNQLQFLPDSMCDLKELRQLRIEHNSLAMLPSELGRLSLLSELDVSTNLLQSLPESIGYLSQLRKLNCSHNMLTQLPNSFEQLHALEELDISKNQLITLPLGMSRLRGLIRIELKHNRIDTVPNLANALNLREVYLGNNCIVTIGDLHFLPQSVKVLDLRDNKIENMPESVTHLKHLERLDITNNNISGLPAQLGTLQELKAIVCEGNPMKRIRRDIIAKGAHAIKEHLRNQLPQTVDKAPAQMEAKAVANQAKFGKELNYSNKKLREIPSEVWDSIVGSEISKMLLSRNLLETIPVQVFQFGNTLLELDVSFNKLSNIPGAVGGLRKLKKLDCRNNALCDLPQELTQLSSLCEVVISGNRFTAVPRILYGMPSVEIIIATDNQIGNIDVDGLAELPKLRCLDLTNNNIATVPAELGFVDTITSLKLDGNLFKIPRPAMLAKGTTAVMEYLRGRLA
eukprot:m.218004 g.218004  ORF g.218004 m.218004 type:complete len:584 (-) comp33248_c0_seq1:45-1796(-)